MTEEIKTFDQAMKNMADREGKYLTFSLAGEEYGIGILKVKEIIGLMPITTVPRTPFCVKGVINLRGKVIPVMDLRLKFGMKEMAYTERTCIIVIEALTSSMKKCWESKKCGKKECPGYENKDLRCWMISGTFCRDEIQGSFHQKMEACSKCDFYKAAHNHRTVLTMGMVVDSVSEVLNIKNGEIEDPPAFGTEMDTGFILGMAKLHGGVKMLLDIDKVLSNEEIAVLEKAA